MPLGAGGLVCTRSRDPACLAALISSAVVSRDLATEASDSARASRAAAPWGAGAVLAGAGAVRPAITTAKTTGTAAYRTRAAGEVKRRSLPNPAIAVLPAYGRRGTVSHSLTAASLSHKLQRGHVNDDTVAWKQRGSSVEDRDSLGDSGLLAHHDACSGSHHWYGQRSARLVRLEGLSLE